MSAFKGFPEISLEDGNDDGLYRIVTGRSRVVVAGHFDQKADAERLVECWNACRHLFAPTAHIIATDEYVSRLEQLRKDALARVAELEGEIAQARSASKVSA